MNNTIIELNYKYKFNKYEFKYRDLEKKIKNWIKNIHI